MCTYTEQHFPKVYVTIFFRIQSGHHFMCEYGVALISGLDEIVGLFCKRALYKRRYSAKETYNFIDPANRSHPYFPVNVRIK